MAQAGRKGKMRKQRKAVSEAMVLARTRSSVDAKIRRGVVPGAEAELCPVCKCPSEGWYLSGHGGKREWYHFGRSFNCVERFPHIQHEEGEL